MWFQKVSQNAVVTFAFGIDTVKFIMYNIKALII